MKERKQEWKKGRKNERKKERKNERKKERKNERMKEWKNERKNWTEKKALILVQHKEVQSDYLIHPYDFKFINEIISGLNSLVPIYNMK